MKCISFFDPDCIPTVQIRPLKRSSVLLSRIPLLICVQGNHLFTTLIIHGWSSPAWNLRLISIGISTHRACPVIMKNCVAIITFVALVSLASAKVGPKVTDKVFFDMSIGGKPAGRMVFALFGSTVPKTVKNFKELALHTHGYGYKESKFHRIISGFMVCSSDLESEWVLVIYIFLKSDRAFSLLTIVYCFSFLPCCSLWFIEGSRR